MSTTLIHIVSGETMQNLLPLLALRPERVIQICSNDPRIKQIAANFENGARKAGSRAEFQTYDLKSQSPLPQEVRQAHKQLLPVFPGSIVNITGGTKLMSLGAYLGASEFHDTAILYCDTVNKQFVQVSRKTLPPSLPAFDSVASLLTVAMVMAAQGKDFREASFTAPLLAFGRTAWDLRTLYHGAISAWTGAIRNSVPKRNNHIDDRPATLRQFLQTPLPPAGSTAASDYLDAAVEAGLLRVEPDGRAYFVAEPRRSSVERVSNLLDGAWLELAVADMARGGSRFADLHWSVVPEQNGEDYGETDLIAVDREKLNLAVISCKTSTERVSTLEHLSSWRDRARTLGGSHATGHLCLFRAKSPDQANALHAMGRKMNVHVHIAEEIPAYFMSCSGAL